MWFFYNHPFPTPNRPPSIHWAWYHICGVSADATDWGGIETTQTSDPSHVFSSHHVSEQVTETRNFHSTSMLKNSQTSEQTQENPYSLFSEKLRNSEMEEIFRHGCSGVGWSLHALLSRAPSTHDHLASPDKLSEPIFMGLYWGFPESYGLNHQPVVTDLRLSALHFPQKQQKVLTLRAFLTISANPVSILAPFRQPWHLGKTNISGNIVPWSRTMFTYEK